MKLNIKCCKCGKDNWNEKRIKELSIKQRQKLVNNFRFFGNVTVCKCGYIYDNFDYVTAGKIDLSKLTVNKINLSKL